MSTYTMEQVMHTARSIRVTDVCRRMGYPLREAGMNYVLQDHPGVTVYRGSRGWQDTGPRSGDEAGPAAGGSVEFLMRFAGETPDGAMMALLREFHPDMAEWVQAGRDAAAQEKRHGLPEKERRPFSEKIKEIRADAMAAKEQREVGER